MKKKLFSILLMICMVFPFAATMLTACNDDDDTDHTCTAATEWEYDDTHHWHECTDDDCELVLNKAEHTFTTTSQTPATIDADGEKVEKCTTCQKEKRTTIPKLVQTKNEMIAILESAVREENYTDEIQAISYYEKTSDDSMVAPAETPEKETDCFIKTSDGTLLDYTINHNKPEDFEGDYITDLTYIKPVETDNISHDFNISDLSGELELESKTRVGENYSNNYTIESIKQSLDYLLNINSEETMDSVLKDTLAYYVDIYKAQLEGRGIIFTYNKEDIVITADVTYESGVYTAVGTIVLSEDKITYQGEPPLKIKDFKVEFEIEYTNDLVKRNDSKFIYNVEQGGNPTEYYIINNFSYSKTIAAEPFTMAEELLTNSTYEDEIYVSNEVLAVYVNNVLYTTNYIPFGTAINDSVDSILSTLAEVGEYSTITTMVNGEAYDPDTDIIIEDYNGTSVYITIVPTEGYSLIMTSYVIIEENFRFEIYRTNTLQMVEINSGSHTIVTDGPNPDYNPDSNPEADETVPYTDAMTLNGESITTEDLTFEVAESEYYIELILYINMYE